MRSGGAPRPAVGPAEYLAMERAAPGKHELFRGEVFAIAGASREHNVIVGPALECEVAVDDLYRRVFDPAARAPAG